MPAKDVRNLIITLVILAIGIKFVAFFMSRTAAGSTLPSITAELPASFENLSNLVIIGIIVLVIILIPIYLGKRSEEKKIEPAKVR